MRRSPAVLRSCRAVLICLIAGLWASPARAEEVTLRATAGLGGLTKPGRWTLVRIDLSGGGAASATGTRDIVVTWGDASVRRAFSASSSAARTVDVYIRTADPTSTIRVEVAGTAVKTEVPVTVIPHGTPVTVCVSTPESSPESMPACSATLTPQQLPTSPRGYEAADAVHMAGHESLMSVSQRTALARWRAVRALEVAGDLSFTPQVTRPAIPRGLPTATVSAITWTAAAYVGLLVVTGAVLATPRFRPAVAWVTLGGVITLGCVVSMQAGRAGPFSEVTVHHTSLLQQIPGATGALLTTRGVAEFPTDGEARLRFSPTDGSVERAVASGRAEEVVDDAGYPTLAGEYGLGGRQAFTAEAIVDTTWLTVTQRGKRFRIANSSEETLRDCHFGDGMSVRDVGDLSPGASVEADRVSDISGPLLTCTAATSPATFASAGRDVAPSGTTTVVVYQPRDSATVEAPND